MIVLLVTGVLHLAIPWILLLWQWLGMEPSRIAWTLKTLAVGGYFAFLIAAGVWLAVPWYLGYVYLGLWALLGIRSFRQAGAARARSGGGVRAALNGVVAVSFIGVWLYALAGHRPLGETAVDLAFPLRNGTYYIASGGSNALMNFHFKTLTDERLLRFRGQSYALDILKLNRYGIRSSSPFPNALADYEIFGDPVYAPCSGTVARTESSLPDLVPPERDRVNLPGNFVAIECNGVRVLLAHLKQGSVLVKAGERVSEGQPVGLVGNSGNSDEPHLHIHAERPADPVDLLDADPVPLRLGGRFLARNDRLGVSK